MRAARHAGVTVLLDGQGADESFGGYRAQLGWAVREMARGRHVTDGARLAAHLLRQERRAGLFALIQPFSPPSVRDRVRGRLTGGSGLCSGTLRAEAGPSDAFAVVGSFDDLRRQLLTRRGLPELLRYEDRNSMAHSVEARVPYLDHRLVELALSLPATRLLAGGTPKALLREALSGIVPPAVLARRDKVGFETPTAAWFRGPLGAMAADVFATRSFRERELVDAGRAIRLLADHRVGKVDASHLLWRALSLELWAQTFLDGESERFTPPE
jgi:asparagine synthase (glutamine-hydrolysing)